MTIINKYKSYFSIYILSPDFLFSLGIGIVLWFILPPYIKITATVTAYNLGITVISILFSVFFAVLAVLMSTTDSEFINFLEQDKRFFSTLIRSFKIVLFVMFVTLIYSISLYLGNDYYLNKHGLNSQQSKILVIIFQLLFTYSLFATGMCTYDALKFSSLRIRYVTLQESKKRAKERKEKELQH